MDVSQILLFLDEYGLYFLFAVVFFEYLNLPGFPSGIIMPALGLWTSTTDTHFLIALAVSVLAGTLGSLILYYVGKYGGSPLLHKLYKKHPKIQKSLSKVENQLIQNANKTVFISKLIPIVRTLVGFPAGVVGMNISSYLLFSALGITIWNGVLMFSGTALGSMLLV